jgi:anti-sigma B factor antagonist
MDQQAERQLQTTVHLLGDRALVVVRGEIDCETAGQLRAALDEASFAGRVMIDLEGVTFIDSSGIAVLAELHRHLGQVREAIVLQGARPAVRTVLAITAMDQIIDVRDCPPEARTPRPALRLLRP